MLGAPNRALSSPSAEAETGEGRSPYFSALTRFAGEYAQAAVSTKLGRRFLGEMGVGSPVGLCAGESAQSSCVASPVLSHSLGSDAQKRNMDMTCEPSRSRKSPAGAVKRRRRGRAGGRGKTRTGCARARWGGRDDGGVVVVVEGLGCADVARQQGAQGREKGGRAVADSSGGRAADVTGQATCRWSVPRGST